MPSLTLDDLCCEAVARCGDDWQQIERYVATRLRQLPRRRRQALVADVSRILQEKPPADR
jgi:hypothetical protein